MTLLRKLFSPLFFCANFTRRDWRTSWRQARGMLFLAVAADITAQVATSQFAWWSLAISSLLTPVVFWFWPPRLLLAAACLLLVQSLGSWGLVLGLEALAVASDWIEGATLGWQAWCIAAMLLTVLRYIRTPKSAMPA